MSTKIKPKGSFIAFVLEGCYISYKIGDPNFEILGYTQGIYPKNFNNGWHKDKNSYIWIIPFNFSHEGIYINEDLWKEFLEYCFLNDIFNTKLLSGLIDLLELHYTWKLPKMEFCEIN